MKKAVIAGFLFMMVALVALSAQAYTINDLPNDAIGVSTFETYGVNVYNFTPGLNSGAIYFDLFSNYPQGGLLVGAWNTKPADLFITETYLGSQYLWAIPLVDHGSFSAGTMYAVGNYLVSDDLEPAGGGYTFNHNIPVQISSIGSNYGNASFGGGSVLWNSNPPGNPDWRIRVTTNFWEQDPNGQFGIQWGTSTCANDVVEGSVKPIPEPATLILLGSGLIGLAGFARRKFKK